MRWISTLAPLGSVVVWVAPTGTATIGFANVYAPCMVRTISTHQAMSASEIGLDEPGHYPIVPYGIVSTSLTHHSRSGEQFRQPDTHCALS